MATVKARPQVNPQTPTFAGRTPTQNEYLKPAILLGVGIAIYMLYALIVGGPAGLIAMGILLPIRIFFQVTLGVIACYITAKIMSTDFGLLLPAIVKLAAVFIFPSAVTFFIPWIGWLIALGLYWCLLQWLFELDGMETIVLSIVIFGVNLAAIFFVAFLGFALHG